MTYFNSDVFDDKVVCECKAIIMRDRMPDHLSSRLHAKRIRNGGRQGSIIKTLHNSYLCPFCNINVMNKNMNRHNIGKVHQINLNK
tara:strand:- start:164 stop:421 length:258 start_codon:yes stop_codon:yes gene_type:complete